MTWTRGLALAVILLATLNTSGAVKVDFPTVYLLLIALAPLALPEVSKLSFGKDGFSFERFQAIKQDLDALKAGTAAAIEGQVGGVLPSSSTSSARVLSSSPGAPLTKAFGPETSFATPQAQPSTQLFPSTRATPKPVNGVDARREAVGACMRR